MSVRRACLWMAVLPLCLAACTTVGTTGPRGPGASHAYPEPTGAHETEGFATYERKLARYRVQWSELTAVASADTDAEQCEQLFALMHGICDVKDKLCRIAGEHRGAADYAGLCDEAQLECTEAQTSCEECSQQVVLPPTDGS